MHLVGGVAHSVPSDLAETIATDVRVRDLWEGLTPLLRNEWICWVISVKRDETRKEHVARVVKQLKEGKRRPCCWIGCIHRSDKKISPSVAGILKKRKIKV